MPNPSLDHDHRQPALPPTPMSVARPNAIKKRLPPSPASPLRPRPAQDPKPTEPKPKSLPPNPAPTPSPLPLKSSSDIKSTPNSSSLKRKAPDALDLDKEDGKGQTFKERFKERFNQISIVAQQERRLVKRRLSDQNESSDQSGEQSDQDSISTTALVSSDSESSRGAEDPTLNQLNPTNAFEVLGEGLSITPCLEYLLTIGSMGEETENAENAIKILLEEEELRYKRKKEELEISLKMEKEKRKNRERIICESMSNVTKEWDNMEKQIKEKKQLESELATVKADFRGLQIQIAKLESSIAIIESQHKLVAKQKEEVCKKNKELVWEKDRLVREKKKSLSEREELERRVKGLETLNASLLKVLQEGEKWSKEWSKRCTAVQKASQGSC